MMINWGNVSGYDVEKLRDVYGGGDWEDYYGDDDSDERDPTHECMACRDYERYIESSPTSDYSYCENCESVEQFTRLDGYDRLK